MKRLATVLVLTLFLAFSILADGDTPTGGYSCGGEDQPPCETQQAQTSQQSTVPAVTAASAVILSILETLRL